MRAVLSLAASVFGLIVCTGTLAQGAASTAPLVPLAKVAPSIRQIMNYAGPNNVTGRRLPGYTAAQCWLRPEVAEALARVQVRLAADGFDLAVYDCYRPVRAVKALLAWAKDPAAKRRVGPFHPAIARGQLVAAGFIAARSRHSLGVAVDLTMLHKGTASVADTPVADCRRGTGNLDMGTAFDCFDNAASHAAKSVPVAALANRRRLQSAMQAEGFKSYAKEWWHYEFRGRLGSVARPLDLPIPLANPLP